MGTLSKHMQVNPNPLSLFDFIGNQNKAREVFNQLSERPEQGIQKGFQSFEQGLAQDQYESTLKRLESGEINLDLATVENYLAFNLKKLDNEVNSLRRTFGLEQDLAIKIEGNSLQIDLTNQEETDQHLQRYLEKNDQLSNLITQTSKLSKFVEWSEAKTQAAEFKEKGMEESKLIEFLKDARKVVTEPDHLLIERNATYFDSQNYAKFVIDKYTEKPATE